MRCREHHKPISARNLKQYAVLKGLDDRAPGTRGPSAANLAQDGHAQHQVWPFGRGRCVLLDHELARKFVMDTRGLAAISRSQAAMCSLMCRSIRRPPRTAPSSWMRNAFLLLGGGTADIPKLFPDGAQNLSMPNLSHMVIYCRNNKPHKLPAKTRAVMGEQSVPPVPQDYVPRENDGWLDVELLLQEEVAALGSEDE